MLKKAAFSCSQTIRKLRPKGWVEQTHDSGNNRLYELTLTESGAKLNQAHPAFSLDCQERPSQGETYYDALARPADPEPSISRRCAAEPGANMLAAPGRYSDMQSILFSPVLAGVSGILQKGWF